MKRILVFCAVAVWGAVCQGVPATGPATAPADPKLAEILRGLESRLREFENFEYELHEKLFISDDGKTPEKLFESSDYEIKSVGPARRFDIRRHKADGKLDMDFQVNWDGRQGHGTQVDDGRRVGNIFGEEREYIRRIHYNHALGLVRREGPTVAGWIESRAKESRFYQVAVLDVPGAGGKLTRIRVTSARGKLTEDYDLDPEKGFAIVAYSYAYEDKGRFNRMSIEATDFQKFDGVWLPKAVTQRASTSATKATNTRRYELKRFARGRVKPEQVVIDFPEGTEVVDYVKNDAYRVGSNGTRTPLPLFDVKSGQLINGPETKSE